MKKIRHKNKGFHMKWFEEDNWHEAFRNFFHTTREQTYDEWRELKSFIGGMIIASIIWIIILIILLD
jgi:hypothetical protein